jgi:hypothetical protein
MECCGNRCCVAERKIDMSPRGGLAEGVIRRIAAIKWRITLR